MSSSSGGSNVKGPGIRYDGAGSFTDEFPTVADLTAVEDDLTALAADVAVIDGDLTTLLSSMSTYALADGSRPSSTKSTTPPGSPVDGQFWTRTSLTGKKKTLFIYDSADGIWYAQDGCLLTMNRSDAPSANGDWLGMHRVNALSAQSRAVRFNRNMYWHSATIEAVNTPSATMSVTIEIGGSDVHTISWDGVNGDISESISEYQTQGDGIRAYVTVGAGTAPNVVQLFLEGQEYV